MSIIKENAQLHLKETAMAEDSRLFSIDTAVSHFSEIDKIKSCALR